MSEDLTIEQQLAAPIDYQWRVKTFYKDGVDKKELKAGRLPDGTKGQFLAYIESRDVFNRLDEVYGIGNWRDSWDLIDAQRYAVRFVIEVWDGEKWVAKSDVGYPNSEMDDEPLKSAVSDGVKRTAVHFGIGRFLYALEPVWVEVDKWGKPLKPIAVKTSPSQVPAIPARAPRSEPSPAPSATRQPQSSPSADPRKFTEDELVDCEYPGCSNTQTGKFATICYSKFHKIYCGKHWSMAKNGQLETEVAEPESPQDAFGGDSEPTAYDIARETVSDGEPLPEEPR